VERCYEDSICSATRRRIGSVVPLPAFYLRTDGHNGNYRNVEHRGFFRISDDRAAEIARGIVALDAEIIALQEINPDVAVQRIVATANSLGGQYADPIILDQPASQNLAIIFKTGVTVENPRFIDGSNLGIDSLRRALVVDCEVGEFDFTMITVHLKSGRSNSNRRTRTQQCVVIADFIADIAAAGDDDVILLGDYNMIPGQDAANFAALNPNQFLRFVSTTDTYRQFTNVNGNFLDGYAVTRLRMTEYIRGSARVFPLHRFYRRTL